MLYLRSTMPLLAVLAGQSIAAAVPTDDGFEYVEEVDFLPRDIDISRRDAFDVKSFASLGESYASGPSAGDTYDETKCRRYKKAQGPQVAGDNQVKGPKPIKFDFIACSGSRTWNIFKDQPNGKEKNKVSQASQLQDKHPDMVTLSIGGNDVGFVDLLDRCVYRFYQNHINACHGCNWFSFDDCSSDCNKAIDGVRDKIDSPDFAHNMQEAIGSILNYAPKTKLFVTGYPKFWNEKTDACDSTSFKLNCPNNYVLPLTKERRRKMNELTARLNGKIENIIKNYPTGGDIHYVDVDPHYEGHRFCEKDVKEPSYRNDQIYFYPLEYWTGGTAMKFDGKSVPAGDCKKMLEDDGDQGNYYACLMAEGLKENSTSIDLNDMKSNVKSENEPTIKSGGDLPDWLARVFHPTIKGHEAYKNAIIKAYQEYSPRVTPFRAGTCHVNIKQVKEPKEKDGDKAFGWDGFMFDHNGQAIKDCKKSYTIQKASDEFTVNCDFLKKSLTVKDMGKDELEFKFDKQVWKSGDDGCQDLGYKDEDGVPVRKISCIFQCG